VTDHDPIRGALAVLVPASPEEGEWDDVLVRAGRHHARWRRRVFVFATAVALGVAVALAVAAPWRSGPSLLDRASAAILSPTQGRVLYEDVRLSLTPLPADLQAARRHGLHLPHGPLLETRMQIWLDGTPPRRFRLLESSLFQARLPNRSPIPLAPTELGGRIGAIDGLSYDATTNALDPAPFAQPVAVNNVDPTALIKNALRLRRARPVGRTSIDGRPVIKILLMSRINGRARTTGAYYVDPTTYRPVRIVLDQSGPFGNVPGFPIPALALIQTKTMPPVDGRYRFDFHDYRYLPATAAANKAADIQAVHPHTPIL
jgi:hypothetical protein